MMEIDGAKLKEQINQELHDIMQTLIVGVENWEAYVYLRARATTLIQVRGSIEEEMKRVEAGNV